MNCDETSALLDADVDGEIDALRGYAIRKHLAGCPGCTAQHQALLSLKQQLGTELPYFAASSTLRSRVRAQFAANSAAAGQTAHTPTPKWSGRWRWFGSGALAGAVGSALVALMVWNLGTAPLGDHATDDLATQVVALHTRANLEQHWVDVSSSDRHQVKPWLSSRLDYSIPVQDWASAGFPLLGARITSLAGKQVATLVYRYREHRIDVFVRPQVATAVATAPMPALATAPTQAPSSATGTELGTVRGFHVAAATGAQMQWLATSDVDAAVLARFVQGLARGSVSPVSE